MLLSNLFVQAASALGKARALSYSLLLSSRKDLQAWYFSQLPFSHRCCVNLSGLLDEGCSAGSSIFLPKHTCVVMMGLFFRTCSSAFLLQVSQDGSQGMKDSQESPRDDQNESWAWCGKCRQSHYMCSSGVSSMHC